MLEETRMMTKGIMTLERRLQLVQRSVWQDQKAQQLTEVVTESSKADCWISRS